MANKNLSMVVGLGNMGRQYAQTKHNVGLMALQHLAAHYKVSFKPKISLGGHIAEVRNQNLILYWPETFMNIAGKNVKIAAKKFSIERPRIIVMHDCLETKVGKIKLTTTASFKGHNGLKSISTEMGGAKDFTRLAIGIGRPIERD